MLLLPDEMFKQRGKSFTITFGKPIPWQTFDHTKSPTEWAEEVKKVVYGLPSQGKRGRRGERSDETEKQRNRETVKR